MKITLLGDSIRGQYQTRATELLGADYEVFYPNENCRFAKYTLRGLFDWKSKMEGSRIVHWNNGLWDVLRLFGDEPLTDIETYGIMLKRVYKRIRFLFPNAKVIFALSTAVIEDMGNADFMRYNSEIEQYNAKARDVMAELGVEVNDLYTVSADFDYSLHSDWVHFNTDGSKILADKVIEACMA